MKPSFYSLIFKTMILIGLSMGKPAYGQYHDIKLDAGGAIYGHYGIGYEYGWNDRNGIGIRLGYMGEPNFSIIADDSDVFKNMSMFTASVDYRLYLVPDEGADKRFYGLYMRFRQLNGEVTYSEPSFVFISPPITETLDELNVALGFLYGDKWVFRRGLVFEYYGGMGYYFNTNEILAFDRIGNFHYSPIDIRFGLIVGYRL